MPENERTEPFNFSHSQPNRMTPGELTSLLMHVANMYPMQFITEMTFWYDAKFNRTNVDINSNGEKFPGQFDRPTTPGLPNG